MPDASPLMMQVLGLGFLLVLLVVGGYVAVRVVRRRLGSTEQLDTFTLQDLRELRAQGQLSDAEYERLRVMLIGQTRNSSGPARPGKLE